jgi:hypothetical protein
MLAEVKPVASWVDALQGMRKMSNIWHKTKVFHFGSFNTMLHHAIWLWV